MKSTYDWAKEAGCAFSQYGYLMDERQLTKLIEIIRQDESEINARIVEDHFRTVCMIIKMKP